MPTDQPSPHSAVTERPADDPDLVLRWADPATHGSDGLVDVYLPAAVTSPAPVVVLLHGGFWREQWDRRHVRPLAVALRGLGWAVAVPEYRRTGGRGGWPEIAADVRAIRARLATFLAGAAPGRVATGPPVVLGHSAGGHLALWWALDAPAGERPRRVVALAPVADLDRAHAASLDGGAVDDLLGGSPRDVPDAYREADVAARLRNGERPDSPLVVLHGADDQHVPAAHTRGLPGVDRRELPGVEHFGPIDPLSEAWPQVREALGPPPGGRTDDPPVRSKDG